MSVIKDYEKKELSREFRCHCEGVSPKQSPHYGQHYVKECFVRLRPRNDIQLMPTVKLFANLRKLAGTKEVSITGATVGAVLNELVKQNPPLGGYHS